MSKENDPLYILNPQTNHYVLKSGKAILAEHDKKTRKSKPCSFQFSCLYG